MEKKIRLKTDGEKIRLKTDGEKNIRLETDEKKISLETDGSYFLSVINRGHFIYTGKNT